MPCREAFHGSLQCPRCSVHVTALVKALNLSTFEATKKWTMPIHNWGKVYGELAIMYDGRLPD